MGVLFSIQTTSASGREEEMVDNKKVASFAE